MTAMLLARLKTLFLACVTTAYGVMSCAIADQAFKLQYRQQLIVLKPEHSQRPSSMRT